MLWISVSTETPAAGINYCDRKWVSVVFVGVFQQQLPALYGPQKREQWGDWNHRKKLLQPAQIQPYKDVSTLQGISAFYMFTYYVGNTLKFQFNENFKCEKD